MTHRSVLKVLILSFVTCGIYGIVWFVNTKEEMRTAGAEIPTALLLFIPFANLYWLWKYSAGVELVSNGKTSQVIGFVLLALLGVIGIAILQDGFNKLGDRSGAAVAAY